MVNGEHVAWSYIGDFLENDSNSSDLFVLLRSFRNGSCPLKGPWAAKDVPLVLHAIGFGML